MRLVGVEYRNTLKVFALDVRTAGSPVLFNDLVILQADQDMGAGSAIVALGKRSCGVSRPRQRVGVASERRSN